MVTAETKTYLSDFLGQLDIPWPNNRMHTIVCHGHSVPAGYFQTPVVDTFNAYPHWLHLKLKAAHPHAVLNVIVTAIGGENAEQGAARFEKEVLNHHPEAILIDYALNDRGIGLVRAEKAWTAMITQAKAQNIKVILLTPTPDQSAKFGAPNDPLTQHAAQVRRLAATHGVGLVDSEAAFLAYIKEGGKLPDVMSQVNHPNREGHRLVVQTLMPWFGLT
jgi:acyl-CoA thioesterase I